MKTGLTANGNSKSTIKQFDSLLNGTQGLNRADPCLLPIFHATMDAERRGCSDLGDEAINLRASYSPEYITCSEEYGRTEDNIVQQSVQCNRIPPRISDSSVIEVSSFCYDEDINRGFSTEGKMVYYSAQSGNVDDGQWLPRFRISSLKSMFRFPCIFC